MFMLPSTSILVSLTASEKAGCIGTEVQSCSATKLAFREQIFRRLRPLIWRNSLKS